MTEFELIRRYFDRGPVRRGLGIGDDCALIEPAAGTQLLVVVDGDAVVSGSDGVARSIGPGEAAVWEVGEPHETRTERGLLALVVEGDVDVATPGHVLDPGDV